MAKVAGLFFYAEIVKTVDEGIFYPVYCLMGYEDYYIDRLSDMIQKKALKEEEYDFNFNLLYGADVRGNEIINICRQFPMMAERRVVIVREFQSVADKDTLCSYVRNPNPTTVLVLCHKHGPLDGRRSLLQEIKKNGVVFESKRLYDNQLPTFVTDYVQSKGKTIDIAAVQMLCDLVGSDLSRLVAEIDKLLISLPQDESRVGARHVEELTGMSKDFNNFELQNALAMQDVYKANLIVKYFDSNPRGYSAIATLASLFNFFSDVLMAYFSPDQSDNGIAAWLGKTPWVCRQAIIPARRRYAGKKVVSIITEIRKIDGRMKGRGAERTLPGDLLKELIYFILH